MEENTRRFYRDAVESVQREVKRQGIGRLILAAPGERTAEFHRALPGVLRERVVREIHLSVDVPEGVVLKRISSARRQAESNREAELLEKAREGGVYRVTETLEAL